MARRKEGSVPSSSTMQTLTCGEGCAVLCRVCLDQKNVGNTSLDDHLKPLQSLIVS